MIHREDVAREYDDEQFGLGEAANVRKDTVREWLLSDESERWARTFHETYETIAPSLGYETRPESRKPWAEIPVVQHQLMVATCTKVLAAYRRDVLEEAIGKVAASKKPTVLDNLPKGSSKRAWYEQANRDFNEGVTVSEKALRGMKGE